MSNLVEYWGRYNGYEVYRYYGKEPKVVSAREPEKIFAIDGKLWKDGYIVGDVTKNGDVKNFDPDKPRKEQAKNSRRGEVTAVAFNEITADWVNFNADDLLKEAMRKSVDDLVGKKLSE